MSRIFYPLLLFLLLLQASAQAQNWRQVYALELPANVDGICADRLDQLYLLSRQSVRKYNAKGIFESEYRENSKGSLRLDASNPVEPIIFFEQFARLVVLDRTMSEQQRYSLTKELWTAFGRSSDAVFWLYNANDQRLHKINPANNQPLRSSFEMGLLLPDLGELYFSHCTEHEGSVYLHDEGSGVVVAFDLLCNYERYFTVPKSVELHFLGDYLYFLHEGEIQAQHLRRYDRQTLTDAAFAEPLKSAQQIAIQQNRLYIRTETQIFCYEKR